MVPELTVSSTLPVAELRTRLEKALDEGLLSRQPVKAVKSYWEFQSEPKTYRIHGDKEGDGYLVVLDEASGKERAINSDPGRLDALLDFRRDLDLSFRFHVRVEDGASASRLVATYSPKLVERMSLAAKLLFAVLVMLTITFGFFAVRSFVGSSIDVLWLPAILAVVGWTLVTESRKARGPELATMERFCHLVADGDVVLSTVPIQAPAR